MYTMVLPSRVSVKTGSGLGRSSEMFVFTTAEKEMEEEARRGEEEVLEETKKEEEERENEVNEEEEMERMGKAVILPSHLPSPASQDEEELLEESVISATGDKVIEEGSGQSQLVRFEEPGSGDEGSGSGAHVIGDATDGIVKPKQEKSVSGETNRSSNIHKSALLFTVIAAFWLFK